MRFQKYPDTCGRQPRPQGLSSHWDGDEKALVSAGHMTIKTPSLSGCHKLLKL